MTETNRSRAISALIRGILCLVLPTLPLPAQSFSRLRLEQSTDLTDWQAIAVTAEMIDPNGRLLLPAFADGNFYRLQVEVIRPPGFAGQPAPAGIISGETATLTVTATGT